MESINALLIRQGLSQGERLTQLNGAAITQLTSLLQNAHIHANNSFLPRHYEQQ
jgi:hypothetical protein